MQLVINLTTAKTLGLTFPLTLLPGDRVSAVCDRTLLHPLTSAHGKSGEGLCNVMSAAGVVSRRRESVMLYER